MQEVCGKCSLIIYPGREEENDEYNTRHFAKYWQLKKMSKKQCLLSHTSGGQTLINRHLNIILY